MLLASTREVTEEGIEYIAEAAKDVEPFKVPGEPAASGCYPGMAEAVVLCPLLGVHQDLIGLIYFLESVLGVWVFISVWVVFHGTLPEGLFYPLLGCSSGDP